MNSLIRKGVEYAMESGKLSPDQLREHVLKYTGVPNNDIILPASLGGDTSLLRIPGNIIALSTDPITGATENAGWLAIHVAANDIYANGAKPLTCLLTVLMPSGSTMLEVEKIMQDAHRAACELDISICGGHTEITDAVCRPVLSTTIIAMADEVGLKKDFRPQAGDAIVVCNSLGMEAAAILAKDHCYLLANALKDETINYLASLINEISVGPAASLVSKHTYHAMHDITEGGLIGALYEMAEGAKLGFKIRPALAPVKEPIVELCSHLGLDITRLLSSGSLIIATSEGDGLVDHLTRSGFIAANIGYFTKKTAKVIAWDDHDEELQQEPMSDELWRLLDKLEA